jgi:hypothetical protein
MNLIFKKWLHLGENLIKGQPIICPTCNKATIDFQYVGDPTKKVGYLDIWCSSCLNGIHISRVRIPDNVSLLNIGDNSGKISSRIPHYTQILPDN